MMSRSIRHIAASAALLGVLFAWSPADARPRAPHPDEQFRSLLLLLNAHEFRVDRTVLDRVGPDVPHLLIKVVGESTHRPTVRVRATAALAVYPTDQTRKFLESRLWERGLVGTVSGIQIRRQAARSLAEAFGDAVVQLIAGLRDDPEPLIREGCAQALGASRSLQALPILKAWMSHEQELVVRAAVDAAYNELLRQRP